jgi:hypothetical protein
MAPVPDLLRPAFADEGETGDITAKTEPDDQYTRLERRQGEFSSDFHVRTAHQAARVLPPA